MSVFKENLFKLLLSNKRSSRIFPGIYQHLRHTRNYETFVEPLSEATLPGYRGCLQSVGKKL